MPESSQVKYNHNSAGISPDSQGWSWIHELVLPEIRKGFRSTSAWYLCPERPIVKTVNCSPEMMTTTCRGHCNLWHHKTIGDNISLFKHPFFERSLDSVHNGVWNTIQKLLYYKIRNHFLSNFLDVPHLPQRDRIVPSSRIINFTAHFIV